MSDHDRDNGVFEVDTMRGFLAGVLVGGLAGAVTMLLVAPQSGERTRVQIRRRAREMREQLADTADDVRERAEDAVDGARDRARHLTQRVASGVEDAQQRGQELLDEQRERVTSAVEAGKNVVRRR